MWTNYAFSFFCSFALLAGFVGGCTTSQKLMTCEEVTQMRHETRYDGMTKDELVQKLKMKDLLIQSHQLVIDDLDKDFKANLDNARLKCELVKQEKKTK